ncbi:hypothetical protein GU926_14785 [Nibribacter ruber]|uniref:PorZ N-terminal beta-propeller domain-containing protein n=1 Tax=Nibribacter ruber TaxID=2698458 RepID=A0A6P1P2L7_9BACT|nr:T9SS type A sorting domain-containing protein [Nibribacter ruber]QHL88625.1 hypothetical protein GU926_14785 [Nibribacter ruber]
MALSSAKFWASLFWVWLLALGAQAQTSTLPIGSWQLHVPNNRAKALTETPNSVYVATEDGFFRLAKEDNHLQILTRTDGFSDVNLSSVRYDSAAATLVVAYENTNLDLVQDGKIKNLTDLLRKQLPGIKTIYHLYTHQKKAYLSTSFGLVVIDLVKLEVKDTYANLGPQGEGVQVYSSTILQDSLFIASSSGVMVAALQNANLLDYRNWRRFGPAQGLPAQGTSNARTLAAFQGKVYVGMNGSGLYQYQNNAWQKAPFSTPDNQFASLETNGVKLVLASGIAVLEVNANNEAIIYTNSSLASVRMAIPAKDGGIWVADYVNGLVQLKNNTVQVFAPNGPAFVDVFSLYADKDTLTVLGGGFNQSYLQAGSNAGFYQYQNGQWTSYNRFSGGAFPGHVRDLVAAVRNPVTGKFYLASYGGGLLEWDGLNKVTLYNETNSPLRSAIPGNQDFVRITSLAVDSEGHVWVVNRNQQANAPGLFELLPDGTWKSHPFNFPFSNALDKILIDNEGYKWLTVSTNAPGAGLVVYNDLDKTYRYIGGPGEGGLPGAQVYSMALDNKGEIWVGTGAGVAVFSSGAEVFSSGGSAAYLPIYERRPLLQGQVVRSIAVDGANRKWMGTDNGVWLFSETGEELVANFTTKNSPLPSDKIRDIAINHGTGEVFIGTEAGVAAYRGTATKTETINKDCLQVFPNPVRAGYTGSIGISGLPNNGWVKITDTSGKLVFEGRSNGGTFVWNGRDYNGSKAKPGVYLVLAGSEDGSETCSAKIAVQ